MNNNNNLLFCPADITIDILSRLPVESVLQCKRVCRTWQTLINDPVFHHAHTERLLLHLDHHHHQHNSRADNNNISFGFFLCISKEGVFEYHYGEYNIDDHDLHLGSSAGEKEEEEDKSSSTTTTTFRLKKPAGPFPLEEHSLKYKGHHMNPVDSCNGLICLVSTFRDDYNMCVYNPLTTECVNLLPTFIVNGGGSSRYRYRSGVATGFGYHPGTKEYKIVRIYYENDLDRSPGQVSVYTLGRSSGWRNKGQTSHILSGSGVFVNGAFHWFANVMLVGISKYIVSFDMVDEEFRIIPSPPPSVHHIELGVLEGCLSATGINSYSPQSSSDVWVMSKEYEWSKKYNIPWNEAGSPYKPPLAPPFLTKAAGNGDGDGDDNKILLHYKWMDIASYDTKRARLDDNVHTVELTEFYDLIPYTKSFASLKALGEDGATIRTTSTNTTQQQQLIISRKRKRTSCIMSVDDILL